MMDEKLIHYMNLIDHLEIAKAYLDKSDAWLGADLHVIIEKAKSRVGAAAYEVARKEWINSARVGG